MSRGHLNQLLRVTWIGLGVNAALMAAKFAAGILGHSQAVVADAVHTFSDLSTDVALLVGVRYWSAPADDTHPHGHRRIETLVTVFIASVLALVAVMLIYNAVATLKEKHLSPPAWTAFAAAMASIVVKEGLYRWTAAVGRRIRSSAMVANAWHHRSDAFSSVPAAVAVFAARIHPAWAFLDHVGAVVVSAIILWAAWQIAFPALRELTDVSAPQEDRLRIEEIALGTAGVKTAHAIRTRYIGSGLAVDMHVTVDKVVSVDEGHRISEEVTSRLLAQGPEVLDVVVHLEPYEATEEPTQEM
jgi:cation diffusion facilitator family transporter